MTDERPNPRRDAFLVWMRERKTNTSRVSVDAQVPYTTLAAFVQGATRSLKGENEAKIAKAFSASVGEIFEREVPPTPPRPKTAPLVGYVSAGAETVYFGDGDSPGLRVPAPETSTSDTVAVEVRGSSLGPIFDTWLVFYDDVRRPVTEDLYGELCVLGLPDGRVVVKLVRPASAPGFYHLLSNTEAPMLDQEVEWAAKVKSMTPR